MLAPAALAAQISAIQERFPDWLSDDQAHAKAAALWGGGCNEHGIFMNGDREVVAKHKNAEATVTIAQAPGGLFAAGVHFNSSTHGFGHAPSIWSEPYATREEAKKAGIEEILADLDQPQGGKMAAEEIKQVRKQLEAQLQPRQRGLFG